MDCSGCKFYVPVDDKWGRCHRFPEVVELRLPYWCGEFKEIVPVMVESKRELTWMMSHATLVMENPNKPGTTIAYCACGWEEEYNTKAAVGNPYYSNEQHKRHMDFWEEKEKSLPH